MERDINVVVRIKEDGTMSFVSGDGLLLKIGDGGAKLYQHKIAGEAMDNSFKFSFISTNPTPIDLTNSELHNRYIILAFLPEETMNISLDNIPVVLEQDGTTIQGCTNMHSMDDLPWDSPSFFADLDAYAWSDTVTELL